MRILIAKSNSLTCDVCEMNILEDEEYVKQINSWHFEGKMERYVGNAHRRCDIWQWNNIG